MLTDQDIIKLATVLATKEDIKDLQQQVDSLRESVQDLTIAVDRLVKSVDDLRKEYVAVTSKVDRHEKWLQQIAEKIGIKLEY